MTEKELKKLNRRDLLEILVEQGKELQTLREKYEEAEKKLEDRKICIDNAGSIAEASLQLSGIFEAAQTACTQYTDNIARLSQEQETVCAQMESESRKKAARIITDAEKKSAALRAETEKQCEEMLTKAKEESQAYWDEVHTRLKAFSAEHAELKALLSMSQLTGKDKEA